MTRPTVEPVMVFVVADRSGSMNKILDDAIGAFNSFIAAQQQLQQDSGEPIRLTVQLFDDQFETMQENQPIEKAELFSKFNFVPRGATALYDAIGKAVASMKEFDPKRAILVILTDGGENASKEISQAQAKQMIAEVEAKGWAVTYLGANQDAFAVGSTIGVSAANTFQYTADSSGLKYAARSMSASVGDYMFNTSSSSKTIKNGPGASEPTASSTAPWEDETVIPAAISNVIDWSALSSSIPDLSPCDSLSSSADSGSCGSE